MAEFIVKPLEESTWPDFGDLDALTDGSSRVNDPVATVATHRRDWMLILDKTNIICYKTN